MKTMFISLKMRFYVNNYNFFGSSLVVKIH